MNIKTQAQVYKTFTIRWSDVNQAYNARSENPNYVPVAARTMEELLPLLDYMVENY